MTKKPGRPATGRDPGIVVRLPETMLEQIGTWAAQYPGLTRSAAIRTLIDAGLKALNKKPRVLDPKSYESFARRESPASPKAERTVSARTEKITLGPAMEEKDPTPPVLPSPDGVYAARERRGRITTKEAVQDAVARAEARTHSK